MTRLDQAKKKISLWKKELNPNSNWLGCSDGRDTYLFCVECINLIDKRPIQSYEIFYENIICPGCGAATEKLNPLDYNFIYYRPKEVELSHELLATYICLDLKDNSIKEHLLETFSRLDLKIISNSL